MEAKKIYEGTVLPTNLVKPSFAAYMIKWLWARLVSAFLWPLHNLAKILVYKKIHSAIGISKAGISGGGSLPMHVDKFFEAIGIKVQNGYGLTETSPVVAARRPFCNVLGTVGPPVKHTEIKVFNIDTGEVLPDGSKGVVKIKGPQVMKGYYKTLAEYERMREEKKKSLDEASRTEARKVSAEEFEGLKLLEKKKLDDEEAIMKAEKVQHKSKETSKTEQTEANDVKPKNVVIPLKNVKFEFEQPRRPSYSQEDGFSNGRGDARGGRFNGGFQGRGRDNSTDSRVNGRGDNGSGNYGNGAPRGDHPGRGYGAPRGDYSGSRDGFRGNGGYQQGPYSGRGNGGFQGNGSGGGYHNYQQQQQQQGGNVGRYQQERGGYGGGYPQQQQGGFQRRQGNGDGYYRQRGRGYFGNGGNSAPAPRRVVAVGDVAAFPPLPASTPARAAAAPAPAAAAAPAASAPAPAQS